MGAITVQSSQADELFTALKQRHIASQIAIQAVSVASGDVPFQELASSFAELQVETEDILEDDDFVTEDIEMVQARYLAEPPFKFRLKTLNQIMGGLRRRTFGFLFARPEMGKTQLLASEGTFLAPQCGSCLLWVNNEEDGLALITRCYQAGLGKDSDAIFKNTAKAKAEYFAKLEGKIRIYDRPTANARDIERVCRDIAPDIIFIDQLDKIHGFDAERFDLVQKQKYQWARELAKRFNCAVVGVCQAGGEGENKRYLGMNDVDSSKTGKQGEADWICGMGGSDRVGDEDKRFLSFPKNKLPPTPDMIPEMRHGKVPIRSIPELQLYEDVLHVS